MERHEIGNQMPEYEVAENGDDSDSSDSSDSDFSTSHSPSTDSTSDNERSFSPLIPSPPPVPSSSPPIPTAILNRPSEKFEWPSHVPLFAGVKPSLALQTACIGELTGGGARRRHTSVYKSAEKAWQFWQSNNLLDDGAPSGDFLRRMQHLLNVTPDIDEYMPEEPPVGRRVFMCLVMGERYRHAALYSRSDARVWARLKLDEGVMMELGVKKLGDWVVIECYLKKFQFRFTKNKSGKYVVRDSGAKGDKPRCYADSNDAVAAVYRGL